MKNLIITIDGASGSGKSSVAKAVSQEMGIPYFDTGAMYRAATWLLLEYNIPFDDEVQVGRVLKEHPYHIERTDHGLEHMVGEKNVTKQIRTLEVTRHVSEVASKEVVRKALWKVQRQFATEGSAIFDGRDMGSVVFPKADVKIFLKASARVRAERRFRQLEKEHPHEAMKTNLDEIEEEIIKRDEYDSTREIAPLICPKNAHVLDATELTLDEAVQQVLVRCCKPMKKPLMLYRLVSGFANLCLKVFYRFKVYGRENVPEGCALITPNHVSFLDPPIVSAAFIEPIHFLARASLFKGWFGKFITALNSHPVKGGGKDKAVFKMIWGLLGKQEKVLIFPEQHRSPDGDFQEPKPGIVLLAKRAKASFIPVYIEGSYEVWSRNRKWPKLFGKIACVIGKPIRWRDVEDKQNEIPELVMERIRALKVWYEAGAKGSPP